MRHPGRVDAVVGDSPDLGEGTKKLARHVLPAVLISITALLLWSGLTNGHDWGDDFSAYVMQAKSIVEGRTFEFVEENRFTIEQSSDLIGPVAYPWGFPLLLAPLYALFGLNMVALKSVGVVCFLLFLCLLWSGFRRQHSDFWRIVLLCLFGLNPTMLRFTDNILSDIPFLLVSTFGVLSIGRLVIDRRRLISPVWDHLLLGAVIAAAFFIRPNGILLLATLGITQLIALTGRGFGHEVAQDQRSAGVRYLGLAILPYVSFASLVLAWQALLPDGSVSPRLMESELSAEAIKDNAQYYIKLPSVFFEGVPFHHLLYVASIPFAFVGAAARYRSDHYMIVYTAMTFLLYVLWSPIQGLRFLFPVLPFYISFLLSGLERCTNGSAESKPGLRKAICILPIALVLLCFGTRSAGHALGNLAQNRASFSGPFTEMSGSMFSYIERNTGAESVIAFFKPRTMRMMTGRRSLLINRVGELSRVDYLCFYRGDETHRYQNQISPGEVRRLNEKGILEPVYKNTDFVVYRVAESSPEWTAPLAPKAAPQPSGLASGFNTAEILNLIKVAVVTADRLSAMAESHGGVECIAGGQSLIAVQQVTGNVHHVSGDRDDNRHNPASQIIDPASIRPATDRRVPVEDFLESLGIQDGVHFSPCNLFEIACAGPLVGMLGAGGVHEDVRVDQDQGRSASGLGTDSFSICAGSPTGRDREANSRTASRRSSTETSP